MLTDTELSRSSKRTASNLWLGLAGATLSLWFAVISWFLTGLSAAFHVEPDAAEQAARVVIAAVSTLALAYVGVVASLKRRWVLSVIAFFVTIIGVLCLLAMLFGAA